MLCKLEIIISLVLNTHEERVSRNTHTFLSVFWARAHVICPQGLGRVAFAAPDSQVGKRRLQGFRDLAKPSRPVSGGAAAHQRPELVEGQLSPPHPVLSRGPWGLSLPLSVGSMLSPDRAHNQRSGNVC